MDIAAHSETWTVSSALVLECPRGLGGCKYRALVIIFVPAAALRYGSKGAGKGAGKPCCTTVFVWGCQNVSVCSICRVSVTVCPPLSHTPSLARSFLLSLALSRSHCLSLSPSLSPLFLSTLSFCVRVFVPPSLSHKLALSFSLSFSIAFSSSPTLSICSCGCSCGYGCGCG